MSVGSASFNSQFKESNNKEGMVRVAEVQTKSGVIKRPMTKLFVIVRASHTEEFIDTNSTSEATDDAIASADS